MGTLLSLPQTFRKAVDCLGPFTYLGSYEIIKNFYTETQLLAQFRDYGRAFSYEELQYFWVFKYTVA
jgi:hypothetical protein